MILEIGDIELQVGALNACRYKYYGEGYDMNVYWGLIKGHLFPWMTTIYSAYSINHLEEK